MTDSKPSGARAVRLAVGALVLVSSLGLLLLLGWQAALGFVGGALVGFGMLAAIVFCVERLAVAPRENPPRRWPYFALLLGKLPVAAVLAFVLVFVFGASVAAFGAGYGLALVEFLVERSLKDTSSPLDTAKRHANE